MAADLAAERPLDDAVDALDAVACSSATVPRSSLSGDVILAQVQSMVVDLYRLLLGRRNSPRVPPVDEPV
jgi:hypothetical protein